MQEKVKHHVEQKLWKAAENLSQSPSAICKIVEYVQDGDVVVLESNSIKNNKIMTLTADILSMGTLDLRHGKEIFGASGILVSSTSVCSYNFTTERIVTRSWEHGLYISGDTKIIVTVNACAEASVSITANGKTFEQSEIPWNGAIGSIEMESTQTTMQNMTLCWDCVNYADAVWLFGDSYFTYYEARWPYYIVKEYDNFLLCGFAGAMSSEIYADFRQAITHGTPKFAVWCLGMNDPDSEDGINEQWKQYAESFLEDCKTRNITPILTTIPNVPERLHSYKNAYVRNSGFRYIDFAAAVHADAPGSGWGQGMLSADQVHPAVEGAKALAKQALLDLPEIKGL